jgi:hypothetical protein
MVVRFSASQDTSSVRSSRSRVSETWCAMSRRSVDGRSDIRVDVRTSRAPNVADAGLSICPLVPHCRWVAKRLIKGTFAAPEGWPANSPLWQSTLDSWRVVARCERHLAPWYRQLVAESSASRRVHQLTSARQIRFLMRSQRTNSQGE